MTQQNIASLEAAGEDKLQEGLPEKEDYLVETSAHLKASREIALPWYWAMQLAKCSKYKACAPA